MTLSAILTAALIITLALTVGVFITSLTGHRRSSAQPRSAYVPLRSLMRPVPYPGTVRAVWSGRGPWRDPRTVLFGNEGKDQSMRWTEMDESRRRHPAYRSRDFQALRKDGEKS